MSKCSHDLWYLAVSVGNAPAADADVARLLTHCGCEEIEVLRDGAAQACIPTAWARRVRRRGDASYGVELDGRRYRIDIEMP